MNLKICFTGVFLVLSCFDDNDFSDGYPSIDDLVVSLSVQGFRDRIDVINLFFCVWKRCALRCRNSRLLIRVSGSPSIRDVCRQFELRGHLSL